MKTISAYTEVLLKMLNFKKYQTRDYVPLTTRWIGPASWPNTSIRILWINQGKTPASTMLTNQTTEVTGLYSGTNQRTEVTRLPFWGRPMRGRDWPWIWPRPQSWPQTPAQEMRMRDGIVIAFSSRALATNHPLPPSIPAHTQLQGCTVVSSQLAVVCVNQLTAREGSDLM